MGNGKSVSTKIMGIVNVTPDSFSDGGKCVNTDETLLHVKKLIEDGANIIDVGGESTAPGTTGITQDEEWNRLECILPQVISMSHSAGVEVSIDTRNAKTAALAARLGVDYINDQSGLLDPNMTEVVANSTVGIIIMHNLGIPASHSKTMACSKEEIMDEIVEWLAYRVKILVATKVARERVIVDPGIGFGKRLEESWHIVRNIQELKRLGQPVCVGHSRKSMLSVVSKDVSERDFPTAIVSTFLMQQGVDIIRVHNVALTRTATEVMGHLS